MAASEMAVSVEIVRLHDLLSKSKDIVTYQKLTDQISNSISNLQRILNTRKHGKLNDDHNHETPDGKELLLHLAQGVAQIEEEFFIKLLKLQKGRFTKVFDSVRFFSVMNRARAWKKMAKKFVREVRSFSSESTPSRPPAKEGMREIERASSPSLSKRNQENKRQRVESNIVRDDGCVESLWAGLINDDDSNLRVISVVGQQACGKTALVRSVFSKPKIKHHFACRAWVHVTDLAAESDRMKNLLVDILKQTPLRDQAKDLEHKQEEQLFEMLHKLLMDHRYLIVVDNLDEASLINKLLVPFVDSSNGSRVIVTTCNAEMRKFADPWMPNILLRPHMTEKDCKKLLRVSITGDDDLESQVIPHEEKILSKCNGSPPAIKLLGGLLSAVADGNWEILIDRLGESPTLNDITSLSFDELSCMMKLRVLYMTLFPKESEVPTRRLFGQWAAEGLLAEVAADGSVWMQSAEYHFHELESRNFIHVVRRKLDGSARSCRMPAFLHKFFFAKAKELGLRQIHHSSDSVSEEESRGMDPVAGQSARNQQKQAQNKAAGQYGYQVRFLGCFASFNTRKLGTQAREVEDLLMVTRSDSFGLLDRRLNLLGILDLEGVYKPVLPDNFGNTLLNLRYLGLRWTVLDSLPESVGKLLLLETFDLKHTNITKVTSAIWNAKNLRHLYLSEASFDQSIGRPISSTQLETLCLLSIETDKSPMISVLESLQSLKKLGVTCHPTAVNAVIKQVSKMTRLESLRLRSRDLLGQPASLNLSVRTGPDFHWPKSLSNLYLIGSVTSVQDLAVLPENLKALTLSMSKLEHDPMPVLQHLKDLIVLRLLARSCTGASLCCKASFPKLRILKLWKLKNLEELVCEQGGMCKLEELDIRQCQKLKKVKGLDHINSSKSVKDVLDPGHGDGVESS